VLCIALKTRPTNDGQHVGEEKLYVVICGTGEKEEEEV
jgi:hypothetical protein